MLNTTDIVLLEITMEEASKRLEAQTTLSSQIRLKRS